MTGTKYNKRYRTSAKVSPVKEPIKSIITEYHLIDLTKEEDDGGELAILDLLNPNTDETRSLSIKREEGNQGDIVCCAWEKVINAPKQSVTVRVLDITWIDDSVECVQGIIMDSHLWEG